MAVPLLRRRRTRMQASKWTPLKMRSATLGAWYSGDKLLPQSVGSMTDWNDNSSNAFNLTVDSGTPGVVACGPSFAGEFQRSVPEFIYQASLAMSSHATDTAGGLWAVFALRSGASATNYHTLISIGSTSGTRWIELDIHPSGGQLHAGMFSNTNSSLASCRISAVNLASDVAWHSLLLEANTTANTYRLWLDGTEYTGGSLTTTGTQGNWLSDWTSFTPSRIGIGVGVRDSVASPYEPADAKIFDCGYFRGTLGGDLSYLLGHLAQKRAVAT